MIAIPLALFFSTLLGGVFGVTPFAISTKILRLLLVFSGGYLLAITLLHLMPTLFMPTIAGYISYQWASSCILIGFFLQRFIETFSTGVAHGHTMVPASEGCCIRRSKTLPFLSCILLHALLDGSALTHSHLYGDHHQSQDSLLMGMVLHKFVEAFAFMNVLRSFSTSLKRHLCYLILFSLASPVGWFMCHYLAHYLSSSIGVVLFALVVGNFLYISSTILLESNPDHNINQYACWVGLLGAALAACVEFLL